MQCVTCGLHSTRADTKALTAITEKAIIIKVTCFRCGTSSFWSYSRSSKQHEPQLLEYHEADR
jgi:predicted nucleic-acid-binding Zn-ribbon protein